MTSPRRIARSIVLLFLLAASASTSAREGREDEWSRFRGPNGAGIVADAGYPTEFGPARHLKWRAAVRPGKSSPVLSRRHVFLTAFDQGALYTQCFDRKTGRLVWERSEAPARREDAHVLNEPAAATPVTDGENVYVFFRDLGVVSYDAAGKVRWKKAMGPFANRFGTVASPIIAGSSLILVLDQFERSTLVALSLKTGDVQWQAARQELEAWATPVLYASQGKPEQIVTAGSGIFGGHAVKNGARLWTHSGMAPVMVASPVVQGDMMVGFGYGYDAAPSFAASLKRMDRDGDGRISIAECGDNAMQVGIARFYGDRDGFIVEAEWNRRLWADGRALEHGRAVALEGCARRGHRARAVAILQELRRRRAVTADPRRADLFDQERRHSHRPQRRDRRGREDGTRGLGARVLHRIAGRDGRKNLLRQ